MGNHKKYRSMLKHTNKALKCFETTILNYGAILSRFKLMVIGGLRMRIAPCFSMVNKEPIPKNFQVRFSGLPDLIQLISIKTGV